MDQIATDGISIAFNPEGGIIDTLDIAVDGKMLTPLHRAPWVVSGEALPDHVAPVERRLAGDFFCAPFARAEAGVPIHGWAANGLWQNAGTATGSDGSVTARYNLRETINGAVVAKHITLVPGHPVVYQKHVFDGGTGLLPVAHHAMVHVPGGARLSFSPKSGGRTPSTALETEPARGRSILTYPQSFAALSAVARADGGTVDATRYPFDSGHEDLIVLTERTGHRLGWSAVLAPADGFLFFAIKEAEMLPQTVLWMSNGGRSYAPWNSRHRAVLGVEEGAVGIHLPDGVTGGERVGLDLAPGRSFAVRYAFGAIPAPAGWSEVADIRVDGTSATLVDRSGETRRAPFRGSHFDNAIF